MKKDKVVLSEYVSEFTGFDAKVGTDKVQQVIVKIKVRASSPTKAIEAAQTWLEEHGLAKKFVALRRKKK